MAQHTSKRSINNPRLRTSFEHPPPMQKVTSDPPSIKHRASQLDPPSASQDEDLTVRYNAKRRTFFKQDFISEEKSLSRIEEQKKG